MSATWLRFQLLSRLSALKCMDLVVEVAGFFPLVPGGSVEYLEAQGVMEKEKG